MIVRYTVHEGLLLWPSSGPGELVEKEKHGVRLSAGGRVEGEMLNVSRGQSKLVLVTACPLNATECQVVVLPEWVLSFPTFLVFGGFAFLPFSLGPAGDCVQALGERGVLVSLTGYPRGGAILIIHAGQFDSVWKLALNTFFLPSQSSV